jgi:N-acylneuraminate cytidylyltransferase/CMP-N,N'-diacetyllegionaminic acid synthase
MNQKKILAIIGARSGSKGVPDKNVRMLAGKPLMAWIINVAKSSKYINRVIVSTDSEKYREIAISCGAEVPFLRPEFISDDHSPEFDYIKHAIDWLAVNENYVPDIVLRLFPTVPFQTADDIDACLEQLFAYPQSDSSVVVAEARQHPEKALKIIEDKVVGQKLVTYLSEEGRYITPVSRQDYPKAYFRANVIASKIDTIKLKNSLTGDFVRFHIIPEERSLDIDSLFDFYLAEKIFSDIKKSDDSPTSRM